MVLEEIWCKDVDWINLVQDKDRWRDLANMIKNLRVPWKAENFLTSWMTSQAGLYYMESVINSTVIQSRMVGWLWMMKGWGEAVVACFKILPMNLLRYIEIKYKKPPGSLPVGWVLNPGPLEYEGELLTTLLRLSVNIRPIWRKINVYISLPICQGCGKNTDSY
jgi:hypothetical protein